MKLGFAAVALAPLAILPLMIVASSQATGARPLGSGLAGVPAEYRDAIIAASSQCEGVTPAILAAQIKQESGWNPKAVSPVGAQGLTQFMPTTWAAHGVDGDGDGKADPFNPLDAIASQGHYMCELASSVRAWLDQGTVSGDFTSLVLAAYNAGPGAVHDNHGMPPFPETINYAATIIADATTYAGASSASGNQIVDQARIHTGAPYVWGGTTPSGVDCSGLIVLTMQELGYSFPEGRPTADQIVHSSAVTPISEADLQPGDFIGFSQSGTPHVDHIGIYVGDGRMIHAPDFGAVVHEVPISTGYWRSQLWFPVRYTH
ncbi:NlpC/P60 family protein [Schaalia hyovaginalis]|uniref:C40 family peptidase n=1 Tax=Schaalia hyovaginalis TaxID=29316 RepID=UPI002A7637D5|nr:NlpC/P60 family protein [Schaalia hyovaginalis]MDY2669346.1 NlpC/P60 family protein [Schaalia hyovaginalis]